MMSPEDILASVGENVRRVKRPKPRFTLERFDTIAPVLDHIWLVKGLLAATGLATIWGPPKSYKSFVALDLGLAIAQGRTWAGRRVRQGSIIYLAGEGATGVRNRLAAYRKRHGIKTALPFYLVAARPNLGTENGDRAELVAAIDEVINRTGEAVAAIFLDTLARMIPGADENGPGMGQFIDNAEAVAEHFDCAAIAVHHAGKDASRGMRGSSALHGAVATSWRVEREADLVAGITLEDSKDSESGLSWRLTLTPETIGTDSDGDAVVALVVADVTEPQADRLVAPDKARQAFPPQMRLIVRCIELALDSAGERVRPFADGPEVHAAPFDAVRAEYFAQRGDEANADAKRRAFNKNIQAGIERAAFMVKEVAGQKLIWSV